MKTILSWVVKRVYGRNLVMMTDIQLKLWTIYLASNCEVRHSDPREKDKIVKVGPIGKQTRAAVELRSGGLCEIRSARCTRAASDIHHSIYRRFGGTNELENLRHICGSCHQGIHAADNPKKEREKIGDYLARKIKW